MGYEKFRIGQWAINITEEGTVWAGIVDSHKDDRVMFKTLWRFQDGELKVTLNNTEVFRDGFRGILESERIKYKKILKRVKPTIPSEPIFHYGKHDFPEEVKRIKSNEAE